MPNTTVLSARSHDNMKRTINAPCLFLEEGKDGHIIRHAPAVDCEWNCDTCGFNPRVMQRRLAKYGSGKTDS